MDMFDLLWTTEGLCFAGGVATGALLLYLVCTFRTKNNVRELESELIDYRNRVSDHFSESARLLDEMANRQRLLQDHLEQGRTLLCARQKSRYRLYSMLPGGGLRPDTIFPEPPKDYAPRSDGEDGTLSERFGMYRERGETGDKGR